MNDLFKLLRTLAWTSLAVALYQELRKPAAERTWTGRVAGVVPYDFRIPSLSRLREAYWAPERDEVFSDMVFGVGWAVNIPVAARKLSETATQYVRASRDVADEIGRRVPGRGGDADEPARSTAGQER